MDSPITPSFTTSLVWAFTLAILSQACVDATLAAFDSLVEALQSIAGCLSMLYSSIHTLETSSYVVHIGLGMVALPFMISVVRLIVERHQFLDGAPESEKCALVRRSC